jgi:hypothetical protein
MIRRDQRLTHSVTAQEWRRAALDPSVIHPSFPAAQLVCRSTSKLSCCKLQAAVHGALQQL